VNEVTVGLALVDLQPRRDHAHQDVRREPLDPAVVRPLLTAIVRLGAGRQHLDEDRRVEDRVRVGLVTLDVSAHDRDVRVGHQPGGAHPHLQLAGEDAAAARVDQGAEREAHLGDEASVLGRPASHGEHVPFEELVLEPRDALSLEVLLVAEDVVRRRDDHVAHLYRGRPDPGTRSSLGSRVTTRARQPDSARRRPGSRTIVCLAALRS
jgi:hypothetical protein